MPKSKKKKKKKKKKKGICGRKNAEITFLKSGLAMIHFLVQSGLFNLVTKLMQIIKSVTARKFSKPARK